MSKRILLIDSDETFAQGLSSAMIAGGFDATLATNSEQGMTLAKQRSPDLIVVCVEAQPTNGYMLCTRLKKDEQLKGIPVILTSANATPDSFEKHKKLKTRAEDYLIKPFAPQVVLEKASALLGVPLASGGEDELLALGDLVEGEDEPIHLSEADAAAARSGSDEPMVVEEVEEVVHVEEAPAGDEDELQMFERAFDQLGDVASGGEGVHVADAPVEAEMSAPDDDSVLNGLLDGPSAAPARPPARARAPEPLDLDVPAEEELALENALDQSQILEDEAETILEADDGGVDTQLAELEASIPARSAPPAARRAPSAGAAGARDPADARVKEELAARDREVAELHEQQSALEAQIAELRDEGERREAAAKTLQQRADALAAAAKKFERELAAAREEAKAATALRERIAELEQLEQEHAAALEGAKDLEQVRAELDEARTEIAALTGEKDLLSEERDDLRRQLDEARALAQQNEERAIKAYGRLKGDEKLREKTRQALQIALQLLEDSAADTDDATTN